MAEVVWVVRTMVTDVGLRMGARKRVGLDEAWETVEGVTRLVATTVVLTGEGMEVMVRRDLYEA